MNITDSFMHLKNRTPGILDQESNFRSAVLLPLVNYQDKVCVLFEKRAADLNKQPGEICFPGGSIEKSDQNEAAAAVREILKTELYYRKKNGPYLQVRFFDRSLKRLYKFSNSTLIWPPLEP